MIKHPIQECVKQASLLAAAGHTTHQKFECERCKALNYIEEPNHFHASGKCEECGHVTDLMKTGCNYLLIMELGKNK